MPSFVVILMLHGVLAGIDVIVNHEMLARLPQRPVSVTEQLLHALREMLFAVGFPALGWFAWHGTLAWAAWGLLLAEVLITAVDVKVEGDTRVLPVPERLLHLFLFINLGALIVLLGLQLADWQALPSGLAPVDYGWASWLLTAQGLAAAGWALRDGLAWWRLRQRGTANAPRHARQ